MCILASYSYHAHAILTRCDEDADNEELSHHHLLVCTCLPAAKPRAA